MKMFLITTKQLVITDDSYDAERVGKFVSNVVTDYNGTEYRADKPEIVVVRIDDNRDGLEKNKPFVQR